MARAEPSSIITRLANGHTTKMGTDTKHDEPLGLLRTLLIGLGVTERLPVNRACLGDLVRRTVANEHGLATPLDDDVLAFRDGGEVNFDLCLSQDVGGSGHVHEEVYRCTSLALSRNMPKCSRP
jgi:hypothetical protein